MIANIFGEGFLPARPARYGLARRGGKEEGEAEQLPHPGRHSTGSRRALCHPRVCGAVCYGASLPKEPAGSPDPCKAELNQRALTRRHLTLVEKTPLGRTRKKVWPRCLHEALGPDVSMKKYSVGACRCFHGQHASGREGRGGTRTTHGPWHARWAALGLRAGRQSRSRMPVYNNYLGYNRRKWWEQITGLFLMRESLGENIKWSRAKSGGGAAEGAAPHYLFWFAVIFQ